MLGPVFVTLTLLATSGFGALTDLALDAAARDALRADATAFFELDTNRGE